MKHKKLVFSFFVTLFVIMAVFASMVFFVASPKFINYVNDLIRNKFSSEYGFTVDVGKIDRRFFRFIDLSDVKIAYDEENVAEISNIRISQGIKSVFSLFRGKTIEDINLRISGMNIKINQSVQDYVEEIVKRRSIASDEDKKTLSEHSGSGKNTEERKGKGDSSVLSASSLETSESDLKAFFLKSLKYPVTFNISVKDSDVLIDTDSLFLNTEKPLSLSAKLITDFKTFDLKSVEGKLPKIASVIRKNGKITAGKEGNPGSGNIAGKAANRGDEKNPENKELGISLSNVSFEVKNQKNVSLSFSEAELKSGEDLHVKVNNVAASSALEKDIADGSLKADSAEVLRNGGYISLSKTEWKFKFDIKSVRNSFTASGNVNRILSGFTGENYDFAVEVDNLGISANSDESDNVKNALFYFDSVSVEERRRYFRGSLNNVISSFRLNNDNSGSIQFRTNLNAQTEINAIRELSAELETSVDFGDIHTLSDYKTIQSANLSLKNLRCTLLEGENTLSARLTGGNNVEVNIYSETGIQGDLSYDIARELSDIKFYFNHFAVKKILPFIGKVPKRISDMIDDKTELDGSYVMSGHLNPKSLTGSSSVNLVLSDMKIGSSHKAIATTFDADAKDNIVMIKSLALTGFGFRLSYSGTLDLNRYFPQGTLILQNSETGERIAYTDFTLDSDSSGYTIEAFAEKKKDASIKAHVSWDKTMNIVSEAIIKTKFGSYDFNGVYDRKENTIEIKTDGAEAFFNVDLDKKHLEGAITLNDFAIHMTNNLAIHANAEISGYYNMDEGVFLFSCNNFEIIFSDIFSFGFNLRFTEKEYVLDSLYVNLRGNNMRFDGEARVEYPSLVYIAAGLTEDIKVNFNFNRIDSDDYLSVVLNSDRYSVKAFFSEDFPFEMSLLGSRGNGFFATCRVNDVSFEARYKGKNINLYNGKGNIREFGLSDFGFNINFTDRTLTGDIVLEHETRNKRGDVTKQGCTLGLSAKLDSVVLGALSLAGLNVGASFTVSITHGYLGPDYDISDVDLDISLNRNEVKISSSLINGYYNFKERYVDIDIDKAFLFGMRVKGYVHEEFDVFIDNLYVPVGIADQFMNSPLYQTYSGALEGRLLVKGPSYDPSFYGTLFIKNLEMAVSYLPDQVINARNLILNIYDDVFEIKDVSILGNSSKDGRFFNGTMDLSFRVSELSFDNFILHIEIPENPIDLRVLVAKTKVPIVFRGDITGSMDFRIKGGVPSLDADLKAENTTISFRADDIPEWSKRAALNINFNMKLIIGRNFEFYYPAVDYSFINFLLEEDEVVSLKYDKQTKKLLADTNLRIKSGRISYINNDFSIEEGSLKFEKTEFQDDFNLNISLIAKLKEYDIDGRQLDISLILRNATLDNLNPHFESVPAKSENEIVNILGQSVLPLSGENISIGSIANAASVAANAMVSLGLINRNNNYRLGHVIRDSLSLDILSFRSPLVRNIIINALPGTSSRNSLLAKYLNGTSLFAGKYINKSLFARLTLILKESSRRRYSDHGHFLTDDLNLNMEFSLDFDNPIGSFSVFIQPEQLSILNFWDNIGFSVTKRIQF